MACAATWDWWNMACAATWHVQQLDMGVNFQVIVMQLMQMLLLAHLLHHHMTLHMRFRVTCTPAALHTNDLVASAQVLPPSETGIVP
jgi:hypothetical protein